MVLHVLRAFFILLMAAVGWFYLKDPAQFWGEQTSWTMAVALIFGVFILCVDILSPRKKLAIFSGSFFGLLVGVLIAYALSFVVRLLVEQWQPPVTLTEVQRATFIEQRDSLSSFINMLIGVTACY